VTERHYRAPADSMMSAMNVIISSIHCIFSVDLKAGGPPGWPATSRAALRHKGLIPVPADT
jgi:hypothetical protein